MTGLADIAGSETSTAIAARMVRYISCDDAIAAYLAASFAERWTAARVARVRKAQGKGHGRALDSRKLETQRSAMAYADSGLMLRNADAKRGSAKLLAAQLAYYQRHAGNYDPAA